MIKSVNHINKPLALFHLDSACGFGPVEKFLHFRRVLVVIVLVEAFLNEFKWLSLAADLDLEFEHK